MRLASMRLANTIIISGRVQGVGFRPFIYRLAKEHDIFGRVYNGSGMVHIHAEGREANLNLFSQHIISKAPPLARPVLDRIENTIFENLNTFEIIPSQNGAGADNHIPPDLFLCDDCLDEMTDPKQRRFGYPFINCTQCGPRYTLIAALPYDRPNTSMTGFPLCPDCLAEYTNPADRRFHAEPLACEVCGPSLSYKGDSGTIQGNKAALSAAIGDLKNGKCVAVKGIGGYHLMCDARDDQAVKRLRVAKHRPDKPLAIMFPMQGQEGLSAMCSFLDISTQEAQALLSPERPIVLVSKRKNPPSTSPFKLASNLAPRLDELGVFLPYSPLHHQILTEFGGPLVATSGNISGEPVIIDNDMATKRLGEIADAFLHHNRPILRPADDSVVRIIASEPRMIRNGRGQAPLELDLPASFPHPVLAVGSHTKNTIALAWDNRVVVSPHIGDLGSVRSLEVFQKTAEDLQTLYGVKAQSLITDAHPGYASTKWAHSHDLPIVSVQHHRAHASALAGEYPDIEKWLTFTWDGVGFGDDGTLWGGEGFIGSPGNWSRVSSWREFTLTGGDHAGREPWRSAAALMWQAGHSYDHGLAAHPLAYQAWTQNIGTHETSAVGRVFDAAAYLITGRKKSSFEGQGPMEIESLARNYKRAPLTPLALPLCQDNGIIRTDWEPLLMHSADDTLSQSLRSAVFHQSLAHALIAQVLKLNKQHSFDAVGLSGGVFQNRVLSEMVLDGLANENIKAYLPQIIPANDGGLAYGQIIEALAREHKK